MLDRALTAPGLGLPVPEWYAVEAVAIRWGITPRAAEAEPLWWFRRALAAMASENFARRQAEESGT